jgi:6-phosphogluconolactonase
VPAAQQAAHHVGAHPAEADHTDAHRLPRAIRARRRAAPAGFPTPSGDAAILCQRRLGRKGRAEGSAIETGTEIEIGERAALAGRCAEHLARAAERALAARGRFALALAGGSAAAACLPALARAAVDWRRADLFWLDERAVPPAAPESNFGLAWRAGLADLPLAPERVHRLRGESPDLDLEAHRAERALRAALGVPLRLDAALAGVGPDGHVASLFPGAPALGEQERLYVAVEAAPKPPPRRLTATLALFAAVDLLVVAAFGAEKAAPVRAALEEPDSPLPIACAARRAARRLFLLDPAAAGRAGARGRAPDRGR